MLEAGQSLTKGKKKKKEGEEYPVPKFAWGKKETARHTEPFFNWGKKLVWVNHVSKILNQGYPDFSRLVPDFVA